MTDKQKESLNRLIEDFKITNFEHSKITQKIEYSLGGKIQVTLTNDDPKKIVSKKRKEIYVYIDTNGKITYYSKYKKTRKYTNMFELLSMCYETYWMQIYEGSIEVDD